MIKKFLTGLLALALLFSPVASYADRWASKPPAGSRIKWSNPITRGLVGCWLLNEGGGYRINDLLNRNTGTTASNLWCSSSKGTALNFAAQGSLNTVNFALSKILADSPSLSISFLINPNQASQSGRILGQWGSSSTDQSFLIELVGLENVIELAVHNELSGYEIVNCTLLSGNDLKAGAWTHVVCTWKAGNNNTFIYYNGISRPVTGTNNTVTTIQGNPTTSFYFGYEAKSSINNALFKLSNVQIWNRILSPQEIMSLYVDPYQIIEKPSWVERVQAAVGAYTGWIGVNIN